MLASAFATALKAQQLALGLQSSALNLHCHEQA
jgi:hypothetical protein